MTDAASAPLKKTPLPAAHVALGARMVPFGGWDLPVEYCPGPFPGCVPRSTAVGGERNDRYQTLAEGFARCSPRRTAIGAPARTTAVLIS
jgi:glycine cleavage system aminomethyltransferase T